MTNITERPENLFQPKAVAMTIAGSDPSGGAGMQADLKTFQQLKVYGTSAVTMITVQNTQRLDRFEVLKPQLVIDQIDAIVRDIQPLACKTGALGDAQMIQAIADRAKTFDFPMVVDPVLVSKHGTSLAAEDAVAAYRQLIGQAFLVTPNRYELQKLTGIQLTDSDAVARAIHDLHYWGARYVLVKLGEEDGHSVHILGNREQNVAIHVNRFDTPHTHGAGCVLSAAITARLALGRVALGQADQESKDLEKIVHEAIEDVLMAIYNAHEIGKGQCPVEIRAIPGIPSVRNGSDRFDLLASRP